MDELLVRTIDRVSREWFILNNPDDRRRTCVVIRMTGLPLYSHRTHSTAFAFPQAQVL
jgi:hypothetical protein